jgi:DNA-binding NarL/FixJ family response regulator
MKIFIVEDDDQYAEFICRSLAKKGFEDIEIFSTGETCMETINHNHVPSLVIMDYFLPGMSGLALHAAIKKEFPAIQTIILSANSDANLVLDLIKKGIRKYVIKNENVIPSLLALIAEDDDLFIELH